MRKLRPASSLIALLASFLLLPAAPSFSQGQNPIEIRNVDGGKIETPVYETKRPQTSNRADDWFRTYVEYDTKPDWLDEITFTFYVRVKGRTRDVPEYSLFRGTVSYIHVAQGKAHVADMFVHPNIIKRFGDVDAIAVEVRSGGRVLARTGKPQPKEAWWERFSPQDGVLLNRQETPFAYLNLDQQEIIKKSN